jgi:hypothetical protein
MRLPRRGTRTGHRGRNQAASRHPRSRCGPGALRSAAAGCPANSGKLRRARAGNRAHGGQARNSSRPRPATRPGGPGWAPAPRESLPVRPAPPQAPASSPSPPSAGGLHRREPHPTAPGCGWPKERARPWSVAAVAEKPGRTGLSVYGSRGVAGARPPVRHRRGSRLRTSSSPKESPHLPQGSLEITRPGARCRRHRPVWRMRTWPPPTGRGRGPPRQSHAPRWPRLPPCPRPVARIQAGHSTREMPLFPLKGNACNSSCFTIRLPPVGRNSGGIPCSAHARAFSGLPSQ